MLRLHLQSRDFFETRGTRNAISQHQGKGDTKIKNKKIEIKF